MVHYQFYFETSGTAKIGAQKCFPLAHLYYIVYVRKFNFSRSERDKSVVLLGTFWEMHLKLGEPFEKLMGTK